MRKLPAKCRLTLRRGDTFRHVLGGAGDWGDPAERDPARVAHDVAQGKVTADYARRHYDVTIDRASGQLLKQSAANAPAPARGS